MKAFFTAALVIALLPSCSKENGNRQAVTGRWELRKETGGFAGIIQYEPGTGTQLKFEENKTFQAFYLNTPPQKGTYEITPSANPGDWILNLHFLTTGADFTQTDSIRFNKNQLIVLPVASCCDIPTAYYERLQ